MSWDPDRYLEFAGERTRPGLELISRVRLEHPTTVVDLGCGTGHLTSALASRWPDAEVTGIDSSPEMIARASAEFPSMRWIRADIESWSPDQPVDLIFSNAALHWLEDHSALFPRLVSHLGEGGVLAVQMPDNWSEPTHLIPAAVLDEGGFPEPARKALPRERVSPGESYLRWLEPATTDMWRTTYYQLLEREGPVWDWVEGSLLRPVLAHLDQPDRERFTALCKEAYADAYPRRADGSTLLTFHRLFLVATRIHPPTLAV